MTSTLHPDAARIIERHGMQAHPEGGFFVETFRSSATVEPADGRGTRPALTNILFLLDASVNNGISRLHRVLSDEVWHYLSGAPLILTLVTEDHARCEDRTLDVENPTWTIPAGAWQAAQTNGPWTLVGCSVGPGFEFGDFTLVTDVRATRVQLLSAFPHLEKLA